MKLGYYLPPYTEINSKWIKNLNANHETIKLPEENIEKKKKLLHLGLNNDIFNMTTKAQETKWKTSESISNEKLLSSAGAAYSKL